MPGAPQRGEHVELPLPQSVASVDHRQLIGEPRCEPMYSPDDPVRLNVDIRSLPTPFALDAGHPISDVATTVFHGS